MRSRQTAPREQERRIHQIFPDRIFLFQQYFGCRQSCLTEVQQGYKGQNQFIQRVFKFPFAIVPENNAVFLPQRCAGYCLPVFFEIIKFYLAKVRPESDAAIDSLNIGLPSENHN